MSCEAILWTNVCVSMSSNWRRLIFFSFPEIESELMKIMIIMITGQHLLLRQRRKRPKRKKGRNDKSGDVALIRINIIYLLYWPTHISSHTRSFSLSLTHMHPHHIISHTTTLFITHVLSLSLSHKRTFRRKRTFKHLLRWSCCTRAGNSNIIKITKIWKQKFWPNLVTKNASFFRQWLKNLIWNVVMHTYGLIILALRLSFSADSKDFFFRLLHLDKKKHFL